MTEVEITEEQARVLAYLKRAQQCYPDDFGKLILCGAKATDMIKLLEQPEACGNWPFDFVCDMYRAIDKTAKRITLPFPVISEQTEEDRVISRILKKNPWLSLGTNRFFYEPVTVQHVIAYMERKAVINTWNADFIHKVEQEVKRAKEFLL